MKKLLFVLLAFLAINITHAQTTKNEVEENVEYYTLEVVNKDMKQETVTEHEYKYNWWKGEFVLVPVISTVSSYFLYYNDNSVKEVNFHKYNMTKIGDTVTFKRVTKIRK